MEHQQLAPVLLLKFVKDTGRLPAPHAARPGVAVGVRAAFRVLKGFRLFIVALPGLAAAYAVAAFTTLPAITWYLRLTASALGAYVLFQMVDLWSGGMEAEIELAARRLATAEAPSPARASAAEAARTPARESREAKEHPQCAASPEN